MVSRMEKGKYGFENLGKCAKKCILKQTHDFPYRNSCIGEIIHLRARCYSKSFSFIKFLDHI